MRRYAVGLLLMLFLLTLVMSLPSEAAVRVAVITVKGMTCND